MIPAARSATGKLAKRSVSTAADGSTAVVMPVGTVANGVAYWLLRPALSSSSEPKPLACTPDCSVYTVPAPPTQLPVAPP